MPKIKCPVNIKFNRTHKKHRQCYLTILPPFLFPYARVIYPAVIESARLALTEPEATEDDLLIAMGCDDPRTFSLHFSRFKGRIHTWMIKIAELIVKLGGQISEASLKDTMFSDKLSASPWDYFNKLAVTYAHRVHEVNDQNYAIGLSDLVLTHVHLCRLGFGMGP